MVRRLRELEKKEAEEEERIREMYAKHFAKNRAASTIRSCYERETKRARVSERASENFIRHRM